MVKYIYNSDLFSPEYEEYMLCHQVNCQGRMGSGVALQVKNKYPNVFSEYHFLCNRFNNGEYGTCSRTSLLGFCLTCNTNRKTPIANLFAQDTYGYDGKQYTDEAAFQDAFIRACENVRAYMAINGNIKGIVLPYKIGCCRGGADWNIISKIIEDIANEHNVDVLIVSNQPEGM